MKSSKWSSESGFHEDIWTESFLVTNYILRFAKTYLRKIEMSSMFSTFRGPLGARFIKYGPVCIKYFLIIIISYNNKKRLEFVLYRPC